MKNTFWSLQSRKGQPREIFLESQYTYRSPNLRYRRERDSFEVVALGSPILNGQYNVEWFACFGCESSRATTPAHVSSEKVKGAQDLRGVVGESACSKGRGSGSRDRRALSNSTDRLRATRPVTASVTSFCVHRWLWILSSGNQANAQWAHVSARKGLV